MKATGMEDNSEAKPLAQIERHSYSEVDWISRQNLLALRSRENFFLDIPFYRTHRQPSDLKHIAMAVPKVFSSTALITMGPTNQPPCAVSLCRRQPNMDPTGRFATGQRAFRSTRSDVVPRRPSRNPSGPSV